MTDVEMSLNVNQQEEENNKQINDIASSKCNNDTNTNHNMETEDKDPLAFDDGDEKMDVDETNVASDDLNKQENSEKDIQIENTTDNSEKSVKANSNIEDEDVNVKTNGISDAPDKIVEVNNVLDENKKCDSDDKNNIVAVVNNEDDCSINDNQKTSSENDDNVESVKEIEDVADNVTNEESGNNVDSEDTTKNELLNENDVNVAASPDKIDIKSEEVSNVTSLNNENDESKLTVSDDVDTEEPNEIIVDSNVSDSKISIENCESHCAKENTVSNEAPKEDTKTLAPKADIKLQESTIVENNSEPTEVKIEKTQVKNGVEEIKTHNNNDNSLNIDKRNLNMLSQGDDPLKSLKNIINRHTAVDIVIKSEEVNIDNSLEDKDLEKELPASIVAIKEENNLKQNDARSSEESDSEEQTLHIADETVLQPAVHTNDVSKKSGSSKSKRRISDTERAKNSENPTKKLCKELEETFEQHDAMIVDYISNTSNSSVEEIDKHTETLVSEIETLKELAQTKENEWNNIIHLKKVKEEILLRLIRKKKIILLERVNHDINECKKSLSNKNNFISVSQNAMQDRFDDVPSMRMSKSPINNVNKSVSISSTSVALPITTSPYGPISMSNYPMPLDKNIHYYGNKKIVPKPINMMPNRSLYDKNGQMDSFMMPMGRQGPTKDVQSIIADYRNKHPETAPRRGRRLRGIVNPQSPQMAMGPRPLAPHPSDHPMDLGMFLGRMENNPNLTVTESMASQHNSLLQQVPTSLPNGMSFKDVLVQFANMSGSGQSGNNGLGSNLPPPPPYPEVTLHPVGNTLSGVKVTPIPQQQMLPGSSQHSQHLAQLSSNQQQNSSLLHGILTKQQPKQQDSRFSAFSPTLARLLTAPEKSNSTANAIGSSGYASQKNCTEITITPVPQSNQSHSSRMEPEVVQLDDFEDPELEEDSAERPLVIDEEGADKESGAVELNESEVPECQGCHRKEAQFVCAGCANQWYCSRECQVSAWDEHSEMCSG